MRVNGLRADDLAGTGLVTRERWALPLWLGVLMAGGAFLARQAARLTVAAARAWRGTVPAAAVLLAYVRFGLRGFLVLAVAALLLSGVWQVLAPASYAWHVRARARGAWRWHTHYRRHWVGAMEGVGLTRVTRERVLFVPRVTAVHSTAVVDVLDLRLLHGHTPEEVMAAAEGLRHVYEAHRATVHELVPGMCGSRSTPATP